MPSEVADIRDRERRLDEAVTTYLQAAEAGCALDHGSWLAEHADLEPELSEFLRDSEAFGRVAAQLGTAAEVGTRFGDYELLAELGRGGMGVVYRARHVGLGRVVALKVLLAGPYASEADVRRFRHEAESAALLDHPNLVPIYEVGNHGGRAYFTMKLVEGGSLAEQLATVGRPSARSAATLVAQAARAVDHAHRHGVLHRDLKPANVLLQIADCRLQIADLPEREHNQSAIGNRQSAICKVGDFGLAKRVAGSTDSERTPTGAILGTPSYLAPEQARGQRGVGVAADVYGLGAILYECLTGRPPFRGETPLDTLQQVVGRDVVRPRVVEPDVDAELEVIALKCLEKEPQARYASAADLAADLDHWLAGRPILARPVGPVGRTWRWCRRNPALAGLGGLAATSLLAVAGLALGLAFSAHQAAEQLRAEQERTLEALRESREHRQLSARLVLERGLTLCENGEPRRGFLWLARALETAEEDDVLCRVVRHNLATWHAPPAPRVVAPLAGVLAVDGHPNGRQVLLGCEDGTALLVDTEGGRRLVGPLQHLGPVRRVAVAPNGRRLLTCDDQGARLWDAADGRPVGGLLRAMGPITALAWSKDGQICATAGADGDVRCWDALDGRPVGEPLRHGVAVPSLDFARDGLLLTGAADGTARIWDGAGRLCGEPIQHREPVTAVAWAPNGRSLLTATLDRMVQRWDAATREVVGPPLLHRDNVWALGWSPDGTTLLTGSGESVRLWDVATGQPLGPALGQAALLEPTRVTSPDGRWQVTWSGATARRWDASTGKSVGEPLTHPNAIASITFSPDSRTLLTAGLGTTRLWDATTGTPRGAPQVGMPDQVTCAFDPTGRCLLTWGTGAPAQLWDTATARPIGGPLPHADWVLTAAYSPDGSALVTGGVDGTARVWSVDGTPRTPWLPHAGAVDAVAFGPDSRQVATTSGHTAHVWDAATGKRRGPVFVHLESLVGVSFGRDGQTLIARTLNATHCWDIATGERRGPPTPFRTHARAVTFLISGVVITASPEAVLLWEVAAPMTGSAEQVGLWAQVATGHELDEHGRPRKLDIPEWHARQQRLEALEAGSRLGR